MFTTEFYKPLPISTYRKQGILGKCIDLIPYQAHHAEAVVHLRNLPAVRYFMNQSFVSTVNTQGQWHKEYFRKENDIFWIIQDKSGRVVGTNRLYEFSSTHIEKGSLIVDEKFGKVSPIALEADLIALSVAFLSLNVDEVITRTRWDNKKMQSMNERFGFVQYDTELIGGIEYWIFHLTRADFHPKKFNDTIEYWSKRNEPRET